MYKRQLYEAGIRCVIAPSFGDIFAQNSVKNGFLTAVLPEADVIELGAAIGADPEMTVTVDLEQQTIARGNRSFTFTIDSVSRNQLLNGWDDVDMTEKMCIRDRNWPLSSTLFFSSIALALFGLNQ